MKMNKQIIRALALGLLLSGFENRMSIFASESVDSSINDSSQMESVIFPGEDTGTRENPMRLGGTWEYSNVTGKWRFRYTDGSYAVNCWECINGKWYHFDTNGWMQTGWLLDNNKWYYLDNNGAMVIGWKEINSKWYYFKTNGVMATGWQEISNNIGSFWYYFKSTGEMVTGWQEISNNVGTYWYYFLQTGAMATGWQEISNNVGSYWYYFGTNGKMTTGYLRISGTDYFFNVNGQLTYDSSTVATVYTKDYGSNNINTLPDGVLVSSILDDYYEIERHDNFLKTDFTATETNLPISKMNKGVFFYSGHGYSDGSGMALGGNVGITPAEISNIEMNNTKVAFFFCCYGAKVDPSSNMSLVTAAVSSGAKASYGYKIPSKVLGDRAVASFILNSMSQGKTLAEAVLEARSVFEDYAPLNADNLVVAGNVNVRINDTYDLKEISPLTVPSDFVEASSNNGIQIFKKYYNGIQTTDKIVYNGNYMQYLVNRNVLTNSLLSSIDFSVINQNRNAFMNSSLASQYSDIKEYITIVNNQATVILVGSRIENEMLTYDCIDLKTNLNVTDQVNLFTDVF